MDAINIIGRWPSREELAADVGKNVAAIRMWCHRNSISGKFDVKLVAAAKRRGIYLTYEELAQARAPAEIVRKEPAT